MKSEYLNENFKTISREKNFTLYDVMVALLEIEKRIESLENKIK